MNISFFYTQPQILAASKTVTRRLGFANAKCGDILQPIQKGQGLRRGDYVVPLGGPIRLTGVRREPLSAMTVDVEYGVRECLLEGFPELTPHEFVDFFVRANAMESASEMVTRLEFEYVR